MNDDRIKKLLQDALGPVAEGEPRRDLWAEVLDKIARDSAVSPASVPWLDWALLAGIALALLAFPAGLPVVLYYM